VDKAFQPFLTHRISIIPEAAGFIRVRRHRLASVFQGRKMGLIFESKPNGTVYAHNLRLSLCYSNILQGLSLARPIRWIPVDHSLLKTLAWVNPKGAFGCFRKTQSGGLLLRMI
jgi:hypothetical protein